MQFFNIPFTFSILSLILVNLIPLIGVIWFKWDAASIVLLYWAENIIIGGYNILKMAIAKTEHPGGHLGKLFIIPFFCLHYGGFCAGHGFFLVMFFKIGNTNGMSGIFPDASWFGPFIFLQLLLSVISYLWINMPAGMGWPLLALLISHGVSFFKNFIRNGEYLNTSVKTLMGQPYKRIVLLHIAIIVGGFLVMTFGSPVPLLILLIFIKICIDIYLHHKSHVQKYTEDADFILKHSTS